jgi:hypothetical protein
MNENLKIDAPNQIINNINIIPNNGDSIFTLGLACKNKNKSKSRSKSKSKTVAPPAVGIEPTTTGSEGQRSTAELRG